MIKRILASFLMLYLAACSESATQDSAPKISITDARVLINPAPGRPAGGYMIIENQGSGDTLISVESPQADRVETHTHEQKDGVMHMIRLDSVAIPGHDTVAFERGGLHLMLFGVNPSVQKGGNIPLKLTFERSGMIETQARVEGLGG